jgi:sigma-B regulation protein RsbU (phosphoserine phosphatase)
MQLQHGDTLFLYTDGLTEAENTRHELFGEDRMMHALKDEKMQGLSPRHMVERMKTMVEDYREGADQSDDLTMLVVRYQTPALIMRNDIEQIPTLAEWIEGLGVPEELNMPINLALEEAVSNVMLYAYPGRNDGKVFVEFAKAKDEQGEKLIFTISDSGIPFDPTAKPEADITLSAEERAIGGLGIHLVRKLMDEIRYERRDGKNILTLVKILNS